MIYLNNFKRRYSIYKKIYEEAINRVLKKGEYILGKEVQNFEKEFAGYVGTRYAIGVGSGMAALQISLMALGIGQGDEVITTALSAVATAMAILLVGAKPVFIDIEEKTGLIDVSKLEEKITKKTKAIIPVHLYGFPCDMESISSIAKKHNLYVIEDACQAHGALYKGRKVGTFGIVGCFSFYPTKNLGCLGDGGMIVTNDEMIYHKIKLLRNYGRIDRYNCEMIGVNSRLDEIQAAILREKLRYLDYENQRRILIAEKYNKEINNTLIKKPQINNSTLAVWHIYPIRCKHRDKLMYYLKENNIQTLIHYPIPIPFQKPFQYLNYSVKDIPVAAEWAKTVLSIPIDPFLTEEEIDTIISVINDFKI